MNGVWTPEMDRRLREGVAAGKLYCEIAAELGKSRHSCIGRGFRLGIRAPGKIGDRISKALRTFNHDEAVRLRRSGVKVTDIASRFGVSQWAIYKALRDAA